MDYSFNAEVAQKYGVNEAIFLHNLYWWIRKNEANGRHYYDGRNWTYNTMEAFVKLFPFWTKDQVRRIIEKLKANGAILVANYNQDKRDRMQWYALTEEVLEYYEPRKPDVASGKNATCHLANLPLVLYGTDSKHTDSKHSPQKAPHGKKEELEEIVEESELPITVKRSVLEWLEYKKYAYQRIGLEKLLMIIGRKVADYGEESVRELIDECISNMWKGIIWARLKADPPEKRDKTMDYIAELREEEIERVRST